MRKRKGSRAHVAMTAEMRVVEDMLLEAANCLKGDVRIERPSNGNGWWPKYELDYKDTEAKRNVVKCTLSEMDARMNAVLKLDMEEREAVWLRVVSGYVMSYRKMGVKLRLSHERVREIVMRGLKTLSNNKPFRK